MTVGIIYTNGKEAVAITDSRASGSGRQSDSVDKLKTFSNDNYSGLAFGTGSANSIVGLFTDIDNLSKENATDRDISKFVSDIFQSHKKRSDDRDMANLDSYKAEIDKKSSLISDENERKGFVHQKLSALLDQYDQVKKENNTSFVMSFFDTKNKRVKLYSMDSFTQSELFGNHFEIGSGSDGANLYMTAKLQGIDSSKLSLEDLMFFSLNAHSTSTINHGVGGTPKISILSERGVSVLAMEKTILLANLSGAYLSEGYSDILTTNKMKSSIKDVLNANNDASLNIYSSALGNDINLINNIYIPYSSWQESSNRKTFENK